MLNVWVSPGRKIGAGGNGCVGWAAGAGACTWIQVAVVGSQTRSATILPSFFLGLSPRRRMIVDKLREMGGGEENVPSRVDSHGW